MPFPRLEAQKIVGNSRSTPRRLSCVRSESDILRGGEDAEAFGFERSSSSRPAFGSDGFTRRSGADDGVRKRCLKLLRSREQRRTALSVGKGVGIAVPTAGEHMTHEPTGDNFSVTAAETLPLSKPPSHPQAFCVPLFAVCPTPAATRNSSRCPPFASGRVEHG